MPSFESSAAISRSHVASSATAAVEALLGSVRDVMRTVRRCSLGKSSASHSAPEPSSSSGAAWGAGRRNDSAVGMSVLAPVLVSSDTMSDPSDSLLSSGGKFWTGERSKTRLVYDGREQAPKP